MPKKNIMFIEGQQIGPYTLLRKVGKGGFGEVWLAEKRSQFLTKKVAIKLPHDEQVDFETISREAALWEEASGHPNVLPIIDADVYDGQVAIVSEYADGGSLADKLASEGAISNKDAVQLTIGILAGLEFLHGKRIIHRDIKPQNILLQGSTPRLADFGISRAMQTTAISSTIIGTDAYMSPEAFDGKRSVQTDIWSTGVVLYQLLNGSLPFPQEHPSERMFAVLTKQFAPLAEDVPTDIRAVVQKALEKAPENRYESAATMRDDLQKALAHLDHPTLAKTEVLDRSSFPSLTTPSDMTAGDVVTETAVDVGGALAAPLQKEAALPDDETKTVVSRGGAIDAPSVVTRVSHLDTAAAERKAVPIPVYAAGVIVALVGLGFAIAVYNTDTAKNTNTAGPIANVPQAANKLAPLPADGRLIPFKKGSVYGFVDKNKNLVLEAKYNNTKPFIDGLAVVEGTFPLKWGVIDRQGKEVAPLKYEEIMPFHEGLARVRLDNKYGFIDKTGSEIIAPKFEYAGERFSEGMVDVIVGDEAHYIDKDENVRIKIERAKGHEPFSEGLASVGTYKYSDFGDYGFINTDGKVVIPYKYRYVQNFSEGLAAAILKQGDGKYGFIDQTGKMVIQPKYEMALGFRDGLARVEITKDKWGFIDKTGKEVIPFKYESVSNFLGGFASVELNDHYSVIDKTGKEIVPFKYVMAYPIEDLFIVRLGESFNDSVEFYIGRDGTEYYQP